MSKRITKLLDFAHMLDNFDECDANRVDVDKTALQKGGQIQQNVNICDGDTDKMPEIATSTNFLKKKKSRSKHKKNRLFSAEVETAAKELSIENESVSISAAYDVAKDMAQRHSIRIQNGALYAFTSPGYELFSQDQLIARMKASASGDLARAKSSFWIEVVKQLKTSEELFVNFDRVMYPLENMIFKNGVFDIFQGKFRKAQPSDLITMFNNVDFDPSRTNDNQFAKMYLESISGGDNEIKERFWEATGAILSSTTVFKKFFVAFGPPNSGKSVWGALLKRLIGPSLCSEISLEMLSRPFNVAQLQGKKLNLSMDLSGSKLKDLGILKKLTSGGADYIEAEKKYGSFYTISSRHIKLVFGTNVPIHIDSSEDVGSIRARMLVIPFPYSVEPEDRINDLVDKLYAERNYVIKKSIKAFRRLVDNNFVFSKCAIADELMNNFFEEHIDMTIEDFLKSDFCCIGMGYEESCSKIYESYKDFCRNKGLYPLPHNTMIYRLREMSQFRKKRIHSERGYAQAIAGIKILR